MTVEQATALVVAEVVAVAPSGSALGAVALALAREVDAAGNSATSKSMCARALVETLDRLRGLVPAEESADGLDELASRRAARVAGVGV